ncbi:MAG: hypothetical protein LBI64_04875 [Coriobacteriales bacterium]|jgi:hypothetical protein|nr:hypothetical protein [Coriobacteriales bacterium]
MLRYIHAELYRVFRKKSFYIYFGALALLYGFFVLIRTNGIGAESITNDATQVFAYMPVLVGGYLFAVLYCDDLRSKNLATLIGYGMQKTTIVLAKLVLSVLLNGLIFTLISLFMFALYSLIGYIPSAPAVNEVFLHALKAALLVIVYAAITGVVVYGMQRSTFAVVFYILLSLGVIGQLMMAVFGWDVISSFAPNLSNHLVSNIVVNLTIGATDGAVSWPSLIEYGAYIAGACALSVVAFRRKELEF